MIITVSGASCTGKTTLLEHIQQIYAGQDNVRFYGEFIRQLFDENYRFKYNSFTDLLKGDPLDIIQLHKETARLFNEVVWSADLDSILVFDRSPIDISIYMYMNISEYLEKDINILNSYRKAANYVNRCINDFMNHNPIIFYTRPFNDIIEDDGFRPESLIKRRSLELSLFDKEFLSIPGVRILPSSLEGRSAILENVLIR